MAKHIKYNINSTNVLISKNESQQTGNISKINICNERTVGASTKVNLFLHDGDTTNDIYIIKQVEIPEGATLILEDNLSFNINKYSLKINVVAGNTEQLSIIIK